ncbi:MAG: LysR family transcriptional regulator [Acidiferrobacterales bacterium]
MHVTLRQLKVFEAVARHLSFTRAAEELYLTQPAVSMQVKQMEQSIGLPLFEQIGKKIHLTEAGREIYDCSRTIARQLSEAEQVVEELKGVKRGRLLVTVASTVNYFASRLLAAFCERHQGVRVSLDVTNRESLLRQLVANETDIVLMGYPPDGLALVAETFMDNPLVVIAAPGHRLAGQKSIPLASLKNETFLMRERGSGTRTAMERFFAERGMVLSSSVEMNSNEAIKQSVEAGLGLGVVSIHTVELELEAGRLTTLGVQSFPIMRKWYVVHLKDKRLSPVARAFKDFVLSEARRL